jgi:C-terminal processing protease CtpA/Prc
VTLSAARHANAWTSPVRSKRIGDEFAHVEVSANETGDHKQLAGVVESVDGPDVCGWVIDIRRVGGGNMWPMLQALRPLIGEANPGFFVGPEGRQPWEEWYKSGTFALTASLQRGEPAGAVLTSRMTGSAGENVAIAFRGRGATRSFGESTAGRTSSNRPFRLPDGKLLWVAYAHGADRNGRVYMDKVVPDEAVAVDWQRIATADDPVLAAAMSWLRGQPPCQAGR